MNIYRLHITVYILQIPIDMLIMNMLKSASGKDTEWRLNLASDVRGLWK